MFELSKYDGTNPAGYYISEKYNGVRALWNGTEFISKNGNSFAVPDCIIATMPTDITLDGELYADGNLALIAGLCRRKTPATAEEWHGVTFQIFDIPEKSLIFEKRLELLTNFFQSGHELPAFCSIVRQTICEGGTDLRTNFNDIISRGGEGVVLKSGSNLYRSGRNADAFKIKYVDDFEIDGVTYDQGGNFIAVRDYE